tara:strand:+ start:139 stop:456 length:318 start_codon:yes stop_codon:yes gene_type:complete
MAPQSRAKGKGHLPQAVLPNYGGLQKHHRWISIVKHIRKFYAWAFDFDRNFFVTFFVGITTAIAGLCTLLFMVFLILIGLWIVPVGLVFIIMGLIIIEYAKEQKE